MRRRHVADCLAAIRNGGGPSGKAVSGTTLEGYYTTMHAILQEAVYDGEIESNPADSVRPPKKDTKRKEALSFDDYARLVSELASLRSDPRAVGVALIALNGLRRSEAVALDWGDVEGEDILVRGSIEGTSGTRKETKTASGERAIPKMPATIAVLDGWKQAQACILRAAGLAQGNDTPVLTASNGARMTADGLYKWWKSNGPRMFGVDCTLHELRHTFLTYLAANGSAFTLKQIAGWSSIGMADTYVHNDEEANREAMRALASRIADGGSAPVQTRYKNGTN